MDGNEKKAIGLLIAILLTYFASLYPLNKLLHYKYAIDKV